MLSISPLDVPIGIFFFENKIEFIYITRGIKAIGFFSLPPLSRCPPLCSHAAISNMAFNIDVFLTCYLIVIHEAIEACGSSTITNYLIAEV